MAIIHNDKIRQYMNKEYTYDSVIKLEKFLVASNVFNFPCLPNGLFPASNAPDENNISGYQNIWVRDNIHIGYALYRAGGMDRSLKMIRTLLQFYKNHQNKITHIIEKGKRPENPMHRPHIRFDGEKLAEINQTWPHAQNDALGYLLWFTCRLINERWLKPTEEDINILILIISYFKVIEYWNDEDSGHWEETRKISASSIGTVLAALYEFRAMKDACSDSLARLNNNLSYHFEDLLNALIEKGEKSLLKILPNECIQEEKNKHRKYDAALLFLLFPLNLPIIDRPLENEILKGIQEHLEGCIGIRRYLGDSYWCADYKEFFPPSDRTGDFSTDMERRDKYLKPGEEAQWCIFDSIVSCIHGNRFKVSKDLNEYHKQCRYVNRALGQLTREGSAFGGMKCPEAYYLENGAYVENDHTPLLWAQANLQHAVAQLKRSSEDIDKLA